MASKSKKKSAAKNKVAKKAVKAPAKVAKKAAKAKPAEKAKAKPAKVSKKAPKGTKGNPKASSNLSAAQQIEKRISELGDWRGQRLAEIRQLIHEVDPQVIEEWKWMGTPVWSHHGMYANANPFKDKVKITFLHGAQLSDPHKLFNTGLDGNKWRAIDYREGDKIDKPKFKALLREAIAYNQAHDVPKSKGSRASLLAKPSTAKRRST
jgi:hypothetical protein